MYSRTHSQVYAVSLKDSSPTLNHLRFFSSVICWFCFWNRVPCSLGCLKCMCSWDWPSSCLHLLSTGIACPICGAGSWIQDFLSSPHPPSPRPWFWTIWLRVWFCLVHDSCAYSSDLDLYVSSSLQLCHLHIYIFHQIWTFYFILFFWSSQ